MLQVPERQYFRVEHGPCWEVLKAWRDRRQEIDEQCLAFAHSVGGTGYYAGHDEHVGNALAVSAITFAKGGLPQGWKPRRWRSFVIREGQQAAWPDQRTKVGRQALKAIRALPLRPSTNRVCDAIGFPHSVEYSMGKDCRGSSCLGFWETLIVGWMKDTFFVALPKVNDEIAKYEAKGYKVATPRWTPLEGMEPILKEEMELAFAVEKPREKGEQPPGQSTAEDLGVCDLCLKRLAVGQFVNQYDDIGTAHADCERPFAKPAQRTPAPGDDGTTMPTYVLLGTPAVLFDVDEKAEAVAA